MIQAYLVLAERIRKELNDLERLVDKAKQAVQLARLKQTEQDFFIDSAALNLHDIYSGLERIFQQIAATVENSVPIGRDWHRELLEQMCLEISGVRPAVLSTEAAEALEELLRFRHVVRNIYTFSLDLERITLLIEHTQSTFPKTKDELLQFALLLEEIGKD